MSIDNVILWYEKNVNYKLTKAFLDFLIKTGIIKEDVNLDLLNAFLLETFGDEFVKENNKFKIKCNRIPVIDKFEEKKEQTQTKINNANKKFKIENLGGKKFKLIKL